LEADSSAQGFPSCKTGWCILAGTHDVSSFPLASPVVFTADFALIFFSLIIFFFGPETIESKEAPPLPCFALSGTGYLLDMSSKSEEKDSSETPVRPSASPATHLVRHPERESTFLVLEALV